MDFASLMAKEISKAKSPSTPAPDADSKKAASSEKKYVRRADLEAERIAAYKEEQERLRKEREEKAARKRKLEEEEADQKREREEKKRRLADESKRRREAEEEAVERERRKKLGLPELPLPSSSSRDSETPPVDGDGDMEDERLVDMLRGMGEPARLFGESHKGRLRRYRRLVQRSLTPQQLSKGPIPTTLELVPEKDMRVPKKPPKDAEGRKFLFRQLASYFSMVLEEWEIALAKRDLHVKQTFAGKQAYNAMVQSCENMKPLFAKFERGEVDDTVLEAIVEIVNCAQERRYVDANDGYLRLSIGKA
jgi:pre-mRNA-splicing factor 18